jgi:Tfp pilus assembly protein PilE
MKRAVQGFTLIELTIIVVIVAVLSLLAIPRFMTSSTQSKQAEAQGILKQIYTMERAYFQANDTYTESMDDLDIEILPNTRYAYSISSDGLSFTATAHCAAPGLDGDVTPDTWIIDDSDVMQCTSNDVDN